MTIETVVFADDGDIPNSPLPLVVYRGAIDPATRDREGAFEALFHDNGWRWSWRNGIFPFHHYHANAHEVLGIAGGPAEVRFGGPKGGTFTVETGDAVLIPAGVGHCRLSAGAGLSVIGAYCEPVSVDLWREGAEPKAAIRARIAELPVPAADPVQGTDGAMFQAWR